MQINLAECSCQHACVARLQTDLRKWACQSVWLTFCDNRSSQELLRSVDSQGICSSAATAAATAAPPPTTAGQAQLRRGVVHAVAESVQTRQPLTAHSSVQRLCCAISHTLHACSISRRLVGGDSHLLEPNQGNGVVFVPHLEAGSVQNARGR